MINLGENRLYSTGGGEVELSGTNAEGFAKAIAKHGKIAVPNHALVSFASIEQLRPCVAAPQCWIFLKAMRFAPYSFALSTANLCA